jgi:bifunctional non-homologous end joining protein LigD
MEPPLPLPPTPMEPVPWPVAFDDPDWHWQVKWDGVRCLSWCAAGRVTLWSRRGRPWTRRYPEVATGLAAALRARSACLDGELVAVDADGRPDFWRTLRRAQTDRPGAALVRALPLTYAVFDLLALDGHDLRPRPLTERLARLADVLNPGAAVHLVGSAVGAGRAFVAAVAAAGLEGAVAKRADSPYGAGRSADWRKVKPQRSLQAAVAGYRGAGAAGVRSLALAVLAAGVPTYVGDVAAGLSAQRVHLLRPALDAVPAAPPPAGAPPGEDRRWIQPVVHVWVRYAERTPRGLLRAPVLVGVAAPPCAPPAARPRPPPLRHGTRCAPRGRPAGFGLAQGEAGRRGGRRGPWQNRCGSA